MFKNVDHIIFDLDGTLVDSSKGVIEATNYALEKSGFRRRTPEEICKYIGYPLDDMFPAFCDYDINKLKILFQENARKTVASSTIQIDGADKIIRSLKESGYVLAIATTKFRIHTNAIVLKMGWSNFFDILVSGDEVKKVKPAPDIINLALKRLSITSGRAVMIGDTINDIISAHEAGVKAIAIKSVFGNNDFRFYNPELVLDSIEKLSSVFTLKN